MNATCGNCRHWRAFNVERGRCAASPPSASTQHPLSDAYLTETQTARGVWPWTLSSEDCGAWSPVVPQPDPAPPESAD